METLNPESVSQKVQAATSFLDMTAADIDKMLEIPHCSVDLDLKLESQNSPNTNSKARKQWWKSPFKWGTKWNPKGSKQNVVVSSM